MSAIPTGRCSEYRISNDARDQQALRQQLLPHSILDIRYSPLPRPLLLAGIVALAGCAGDRPADTPLDVPVWRLSDEPTLTIGVVEGDPTYELYGATSSLRLEDGRIVVANTGSGELRFYDAEGGHLTTVGRRGGGPGEFRLLRRIYHHGPDSILTFDAAGDRISVFDTRGTFVRSFRADSVAPDRRFQADVWLYGRFWIEGALGDTDRERAMRAVRPLVVSDTAPGFRYALATGTGRVWIREPRDSSETAWQWTVIDSSGTPVAAIRTPPRFDLHEVGPDWVLGRWRDPDDVNFIRLYGLERTEATVPLPAWMVEPARASAPAAEALDRETIQRSIMSLLRNLVVAQESYFADHMTYASAVADLPRWESPEEVRAELVRSSNRGWVAVLIPRDAPFICGIGVGAVTPPGWGEGTPLCGE